MDKIFYIDVETTGVKPEVNALIQIGGIIEIDGEEKERIDIKARPFPDDIIEQEALDHIGLTEEEIIEYPDPKKSYHQLISHMKYYVDRYDRGDKFHFVGYNSRFDDSFIRAWFKKMNDVYYGSWFHWPALDISNLAAIELMDRRGKMKNFQLMTVAQELGLDVDESKAHDAFYDILVTRDMHKILTG